MKAIPKPKKKRNLVTDRMLDDLVRKYIQLISGGYCKRCGRYVGVKNIEAAHMYKRKRKTVRWDLRNVYPLCRDNPSTGQKGCHGIVDNSQIKLVSFMYQVMTQEEVEGLEKLANMTIKESPIDRAEIKKFLKEKISLLEAE